jgi:hypothetical protein
MSDPAFRWRSGNIDTRDLKMNSAENKEGESDQSLSSEPMVPFEW